MIKLHVCGFYRIMPAGVFTSSGLVLRPRGKMILLLNFLFAVFTALRLSRFLPRDGPRVKLGKIVEWALSSLKAEFWCSEIWK